MISDAPTTLALAQEHIGGDWLLVLSRDIQFSELQGGGCAKLYRLQDPTGTVRTCPNLLIRIYGGKLYDPENDTIGRLSESAQAVLSYKWGELGHGPTQFAFLSGGRIEEFVPSRHRCDSDLDNPELVEQIAVKVALYHGMHKLVPTTQKARDPFNTINKHTVNWSYEWLSNILTEKLSAQQLRTLDMDLLSLFDFKTECTWLKEKIEAAGHSPLVHAHYDLNSGNVLIRDEPDRHGHSVMLVDYEGACMASRGFDLSTFFNFHLIDSTKSDFLSGRSYPSEEYRRSFIGLYLRQWEKENKLDPVWDTVDHILEETNLLGLVHAVFLLSWWIVPGDFAINDPEFLAKFVKMGEVMLSSYFQRKESWFVGK